jgi:hypothetical protein
MAARALVALGMVLLACVLAPEAPAQSSRCFENGDVVAFDGMASHGARPGEWALNLPRPICVARDVSASGTNITRIRIIGTPPPLGVPLELTGKLVLGHSAAESTMIVALVVSSGRKFRTTESTAPHGAPAPRFAERCDGPPYGGSSMDYQAFVQRFGRIVRPERILAGICKAKFGDSPRDGLHRLGLTDAKIDSENTERLAADTIVALKNLVNTIE